MALLMTRRFLRRSQCSSGAEHAAAGAPRVPPGPELLREGYLVMSIAGDDLVNEPTN